MGLNIQTFKKSADSALEEPGEQEESESATWKREHNQQPCGDTTERQQFEKWLGNREGE